MKEVKAYCHPTRKHVAHGLCNNCYKRKWTEEHPEYDSNNRKRNATCHPSRKMVGKGLCQPCYMRRWWLFKNYGLHQEDLDRMWSDQNGICPICLDKIEFYGQGVDANRGFSVDHSHVTGKVRGLLCHRCNNGIGCMNDNIEVLKRAITYLEIS